MFGAKDLGKGFKDPKKIATEKYLDREREISKFHNEYL